MIRVSSSGIMKLEIIRLITLISDEGRWQD